MASTRPEVEALLPGGLEFLTQLSHEIRTPMTAIMGMTDLLLTSDVDREQREYLKTIKESGERLMRLFVNTLDYARLGGAGLDFEWSSIGLRTVLRDTLRSAAPRARAKQLEIVCHIDRDVPDAVVCDPRRLAQLIDIVLHRAIETARDGELFLSVALESEFGNEVSLRFTMELPEATAAQAKLSNGSEDEQARASSAFNVALDIEKMVATELAQAMGGELQFDASSQRAPRYLVRVKLLKQHRGTVGAKDGAAALVTAKERLAKDRMALVVAPRPKGRQVLAEMARFCGLTPTLVADHDWGLAEFNAALENEQRFSVALIDADLPDDDAWRLARAIQQSGVDQCQIIMLHATDQRPDLAPGKRIWPSAQAWLEKPVFEDELRASLNRMSVTIAEAIEPTREVANDQATSRKLRILLAEDTPAGQMVAVKMLTRLGYEVEVANDGRQALERWRNEPFDLVMLDVEMPELDSFQVTSAIREAEAGTKLHIPIIALAATRDAQERLRCMAAGMDGQLGKPLDARELRQTIQTLTHAEPAGQRVDVDPRGAIERLGGDEQLYGEVIGFFFNDYAILRGQLERSLAAGDEALFRRSAHSLKGLARSCGAEGVGRQAAELEKLSIGTDAAHAAQLLPDLEAKMDATRLALNEFHQRALRKLSGQ